MNDPVSNIGNNISKRTFSYASRHAELQNFLYIQKRESIQEFSWLGMVLPPIFIILSPWDRQLKKEKNWCAIVWGIFLKKKLDWCVYLWAPTLYLIA